MKKQFVFLAIFLLSFTVCFNAYCAININYKNSLQEFGVKGEPIISADVLATQNGVPIVLNSANSKLIQSEAKLNDLIQFGEPDSEGFQKITWTSAIIHSQTSATFELVVTHNNETGSRQFPPLYNFGYELRCFTIPGDFPFPEISLIDQDFFQFSFGYRDYFYTDRPVWLDSITFTSPNFRYHWSGAQTDLTGAPPNKKLFSEAEYNITVLYDRPPGNPFVREYMTFHFGGGATYRIQISTKPYVLDAVPVLKLLSPRGGDKFAPCDSILIEWAGQNQSKKIYLEYSTDGKRNWNPIATVYDGTVSSYLWEVPKIESNNCFVRVYQSYESETPQFFNYDFAAINSAEFNTASNRAITTSSEFNIVEWDLYSTGQPTVLTAVKAADSTEILFANYLKDNEIILALDAKNNNLLYINSGINSIQKSVKIPDNFAAKKFIVDSKQRFVCLQPAKYGNRLLFVDFDGNLITYHEEAIPITNVTANTQNDELYIALLDNTIKILSLANFPAIQTTNVYDFATKFNLIEALSVSQDARLTGITTKNYTNGHSYSQKPTDNLIYDKKTDLFFKNLRLWPQTAMSIDFNPTGTLGIVGFPKWPQINIMNLTDSSSDGTTLVPQIFNTLYGFTLAKTGNAMIAYTQGMANCQLINFSLPEFATNSEPFAIVQPILTMAEIKIDDLIIGTENHYTFPLVLCNNGDVDAIFEAASFSQNLHFKLENITFPLTLKPNECIDISVTVLPLDTGLLIDELRFSTCSADFSFQFSVRSLNRKLTPLVSNPFDFGEVCLNEPQILELELFRNDDTVEVLVNDIYFESNQNFTVEYFPRDTILQPNEIYVATLKFIPSAMGELQNRLIIRHSNQSNVTVTLPMIGTGIGTSLEVSHHFLPFIPEIRRRTLTVRNTGTTVLFVENVAIEPPGTYAVHTQFPLYINPDQTLEIEVEYLGETIENAQLKLLAKPCALAEDIILQQYNGDVTLTIPRIEADPRDLDVEIPINFVSREAHAYRGERTFYAEIAINPRIFLPQNVSSDFGVAELIRNEIVNDKRIFGIKITGNFDSHDGELARITGIAGLCEVDNSAIEFIKSSDFFGKSVTVTANDGIFQLIELCPDRLFLHNFNNLKLVSVSPNPASDFARIDYEILDTVSHPVIFELFDFSGELLTVEHLNNLKGLHSKDFDISRFSQGSYRIVLRCGLELRSYSLNIIR